MAKYVGNQLEVSSTPCKAMHQGNDLEYDKSTLKRLERLKHLGKLIQQSMAKLQELL